jgi:hypothetical protein
MIAVHRTGVEGGRGGSVPSLIWRIRIAGNRRLGHGKKMVFLGRISHVEERSAGWLING